MWTVGGGEPRHLAGPGTPLREPAWSTDGQQVVFRGTLAGRIGTWRVAAAGGRPERLTQAELGDFEPHMNAVGTVVFASSRDGNAELYERSPEGQLTRLTAHVHDDIHPRYAPDGSAIAWLSDVDGRRQLMVRRGEAPATHVGEPDRSQHAFAWSPDSASLAVAERDGPSYRLAVHSLNGTEPTIYDYDADPSPPAYSSDASTLCWTSDGRGHVVVRCARNGGAVYDAVISNGSTDSWLPRLLSGTNRR